MKRTMIFFAALIMLASPIANAATAMVSGKVMRVLVADEGRFGGCMIALDTTITGTLPNCPGVWVSFSCSGDFTTKDVAYRMLDLAQMAKALDQTITVQVDDTKTHNGYCYAARVDVN